MFFVSEQARSTMRTVVQCTCMLKQKNTYCQCWQPILVQISEAYNDARASK